MKEEGQDLPLRISTFLPCLLNLVIKTIFKPFHQIVNNWFDFHRNDTNWLSLNALALTFVLANMIQGYKTKGK